MAAPPLTSKAHTTRWAAALALTYLFSLAAAFFWTYLPRYFVSVGWTSAGIGLVLGVGTLVRVLAMPTWARFAERSSSTTAILRGVSTIGAALLWLLPEVESTWAVFLLFAAMYGTWNAFLPLADSLTVRQLGSGAFGRIRAFGSVGFGVAAVLVAVAAAGESHAVVAGWAPRLVALLGTFGALATWFYPNDEVAIRSPALSAALRLLKRPALMWCLPLWAMHWASQAPYNLFLVFLAEERQMAGWVPGAAVAVGVAAEALVLGLGRSFIDRRGPEVAFAVAAGCTAVRWLACSVVQSDLVLVAIQALHGITFGLFLLSAMAILDREVRAEVRDSGQALFYVLVFGGGSALGNSVSGWLADEFGAATAFRAAAGLEVIATIGAIYYATSVVRRLTNER